MQKHFTCKPPLRQPERSHFCRGNKGIERQFLSPSMVFRVKVSENAINLPSSPLLCVHSSSARLGELKRTRSLLQRPVSANCSHLDFAVRVVPNRPHWRDWRCQIRGIPRPPHSIFQVKSRSPPREMRTSFLVGLPATAALTDAAQITPQNLTEESRIISRHQSLRKSDKAPMLAER